jgi:hypothetical protein
MSYMLYQKYQENIPEILKDESVIIEHFQKHGNPFHFNSNLKKEIENQLKTMEEDMMYKAESDSTITYKEIKKARKCTIITDSSFNISGIFSCSLLFFLNDFKIFQYSFGFLVILSERES